MKLFIAEKPSLARAIAAGIDVGKKSDGYISLNDGNEIVTWCFGHLLEQLNPDEYDAKYQRWCLEDLPIIPSKWKLKVKTEATKQFKIIRELINKATTVVNAGDPDREGQLLVDEVLEYIGNKKPVQRILLNALDEKSVRQSLNNLRSNKDFQGLSRAALGRSRADWLIGMNLSRAYTIKARQAGYETVSVGRVMTPTMALVVRREEEIKNFKSVTYYVVKAIFLNNHGEIPTTWQMSDAVASLDSEGRLLDLKVAEKLIEKLNDFSPRTGELKRTSDVTPEQFQETFGFRGVEFGTWVENATRQENLNNAYDALMDMAEALNLPPRALSLNGSLGLAFGARGRGGKNAPLAHYEPVKVVINLTKNKGAGSLGHEWLHSLDNYFGRKERETMTAMISHCVNQFKVENVSSEIMEGFKLVSKVIAGSGIVERCQNLDKRREKPYCQNLDKRREKPYWTLPEEMLARAFEVYLKSKLEEQGIRNDYLVNYRSEESWAKATENGFKMDNTYPYPTATEVADIKMAFDYLFDSVRFKMHDKNCELYSATAENISELVKESKLLSTQELNSTQKAWQKMSEEVFGIDLKYFKGAPELHGRYDDDNDTMYLNKASETSLDWTFWHEAFHIMKKHELELYEDILSHVERHEIFTTQQIEDYRKAVKQPQMSKSRAMEEMLADAFADMKTGRRVFEQISKENQSLADRLAAFTQKLLDGVKKFFKAKEVREKYPAVTLSSKQFKDFVTRIDENVCSMLQDGRESKNSTGYKILATTLHSPYEYAPTKQKRFDIESAKELTKKYSSDSVQKVIQDLSPLGRQNKNYGKEIMQEVKVCGR